MTPAALLALTGMAMQVAVTFFFLSARPLTMRLILKVGTLWNKEHTEAKKARKSKKRQYKQLRRKFFARKKAAIAKAEYKALKAAIKSTAPKAYFISRAAGLTVAFTLAAAAVNNIRGEFQNKNKEGLTFTLSHINKETWVDIGPLGVGVTFENELLEMGRSKGEWLFDQDFTDYEHKSELMTNFAASAGVAGGVYLGLFGLCAGGYKTKKHFSEEPFNIWPSAGYKALGLSATSLLVLASFYANGFEFYGDIEPDGRVTTYKVGIGYDARNKMFDFPWLESFDRTFKDYEVAFISADLIWPDGKGNGVDCDFDYYLAKRVKKEFNKKMERDTDNVVDVLDYVPGKVGETLRDTARYELFKD